MQIARLFRKKPLHRSGRPQDVSRTLIAREVAGGRSFLDVGCMWMVHGGYAFHAVEHGARPVVGLDVEPDTPEFRQRNAARGEPVRFVRGDVNDPGLPDALGTFDVVFCSGVLYHVPNPVLTLQRLRRLTRERLILTTASTIAIDTPQAAVLVPFLDAHTRGLFTYRTPHAKVGLDTAFEDAKGYGNWFWLPTPSCVSAMVRLAGMEVLEEHVFKYVTTLVARPV